jgi:ribulose-bisphosphate carboxylase large chain
MAEDRVLATYWIETALPVEQAAAALAGEQSTGTFVRVPGETDELRERHAARIEAIRPVEAVETPSLPGAKVGQLYHRAELDVSFPLVNMGPSLTTLLATIAGNLFELREFSGLKLRDVELPAAFAEAYPGPQFGIEGTRRLAGVFDRPIIGTIVKPSVGLSPHQTAELVGRLAEAGIDFIKDDELMANPPHSPLSERVAAVMRVINDHADRTGKKVMYAFNISDEPEAMCRHHDVVLAHGGTCVMASVNSVGVAGICHLRRYAQLPIHAHRNGWGMLTRCPALGIEFPAYQKIWRIAGVDHLHVNGLANKFWEPDDSVVRSIKACHAALFGGWQIMPVVSSGQWGGQAPETYRRCGSVDLMYLAGGGMIAHPDGPAAGCRALRQAWEAAVAGISLSDYAAHHSELRKSLETFGGRGG